MFIYSVIRYGNDVEGPDGEDTEFIVLSSSVENAAKIVDEELRRLPHDRVTPFCQAVALIAESYSDFKKTLILHGPITSSLSKFGLGIPDKNIWKRCEQTGEGPWILMDEY